MVVATDGHALDPVGSRVASVNAPQLAISGFRPSAALLSRRLLPWALVALWGCDGPCRALAERICDCEFNARERAACIQEIDSNESVRPPTDEENERCSELMDSCTCDALENQEFDRCGLTKRPG